MSISPLELDQQTCRDADSVRHREWLVVNGRGGYAMATVSGMLTRRYHGLLVAAIRPPIERFVLLAKLDVTVSIDGLTYELGTNEYPEVIDPRGFALLESFRPRPIPRWRWRLGNALVEQRLCMAPGEDTTFVQLRLLEGPGAVGVAVRPLCTSRHFHTLTRYGDMGPPTADAVGDRIDFCWSGDRPAWRLSHNGVFQPKPDWYYDFVLAEEANRGQESRQDLFMPGVVSATIERGDQTGVVFAASTGQRSWRDAASVLDSGDRPRGSVREDRSAEASEDPLVEALRSAADDFVVAREDGSRTITAGYPWFGDWGRDTFISLTGLCLVTGRFDVARSIIEGYVPFISGGRIPNRFPPFETKPAYNTADASLWFVHALERYLAYSGDRAFACRMYPAVAGIIEAHIAGTRDGIRVADDGLLEAGGPGTQLTWMDAKVGDHVVTPRVGKPVEINALWYNALLVGADLADGSSEAGAAARWQAAAERCRGAFNERFWNDDLECLFDVVDECHEPGRLDPSLRPNQLFAVSLTHPILDAGRWESVVRVCEEYLWTPLGMRTLGPDAPAYCRHYRGDLAARDRCYHQGTVWPWLLGPFVTAWCRSRPPSEAASARRFLQGLDGHLGAAGLGGISEVADGDAPHTPGGCPWQAWSVAEPLRALCEDVFKTHPPPPREVASPRRAVAHHP